jgi:outer membrane lipoprotein-sorting protein
MRKTVLLAPALILLLIIGCAGSQKMNHLRVGMSRAEVISAMGTPTSTSEKGDALYLRYRLSSGGMFREDYFVKLTADKVEAYGRAGDFGLGY